MSRAGLGSTVLFVALAAAGLGLAAWKRSDREAAAAEAALQPEPMESVTVDVARTREHQLATTAIGTVLALRSVELENELSGTVREVHLAPGEVVETGQLLVALDVAVEEAELAAQEAQAALAETLLGRMQRARENRGASEADVDRARAERDIALANVARTKAIIGRKTIRAPFRSRVGLSNVHEGQYLDTGTILTTLQGIDEAVHVDFAVPQAVAVGLGHGAPVGIATGGAETDEIEGEIVALDARVNESTRNVLVRARVTGPHLPSPGASVRVRVPIGPAREVVSVRVSALRKGPAGDHVFVIAPDGEGRPRAHLRPVTGGAMLGNDVVIESGLEPGEEVATSGSFKLREGVLVAVAAPADVETGH